jgi:hypothetical protein
MAERANRELRSIEIVAQQRGDMVGSSHAKGQLRLRKAGGVERNSFSFLDEETE